LSELVATLERPLPAALPAGTATAVFCIGTCSHRSQRLVDLQIAVDGIAHPPSAFGMPRAGPAVRDSGFWGTVPIPPHTAGSHVEVGVHATLEGGATATAQLAEIEIVAAPGRAVAGGDQIAVCMATFEPDPALFAAQLGSLRAQHERNWICVISDDCSAPECYAEIERAVGADGRFVLSRSEHRLGFYRNFERALSMAPAGAGLIALCDQDDRWHPDKLATLRAALDAGQRAILAYSDMRLVERDGTVLRDTLWRGRRNNHDNLASMLVANTITGAATLFRRELLELLLPFPDTPGYQFHDHWLGIAALAAGELAYVDRPLYDYVQHPGAVFGDVTHGRPRRRGRAPGRARAAYFHGYLARAVQAAAVLARAGDRLAPRKLRTLERLIACDSSPAALAWLLARPARALIGRTETLASEAELAYGVLWKQLAVAAKGSVLARRGPLSEASVPPPERFTQKRLRRWRARI
jgi:hypothetical protein